jgi:peroxiredoxin
MKQLIAGVVIGLAALSGSIVASAAPKDSSIGLTVGQHAPNVSFQTIDGKSVSLESLYAKGPIVVTFYRGGWCPYCTKALAAWEAKLPELKSAGGSLIAVTLEKAEKIEATQEKAAPDITILGDPAAEAAKAFGILFTVDEATQKKYKGYGIDVAANNSNGQWTLPHPGTFVIDTKGVIRWAWVNEDYTKRADPQAVIDAVKAITASKN